MRLAVVGTGGVGGYFGGRLAAHGHDVSFVARGDHLRALRREGLAVQSVAGSFTVQPVQVTDDTREIGVVDHVLLCVKTWQLPPAIAMLAPLLGPGSAVMTLQNGVDAPEQVAAAVGRDAVLPGIAKIFASLDGPGRVSHAGGPASLTFAEWNNQPSDRVQQLRAALTESGVTAVTPADIWVELWSKFVFVVPLGGLGAATGVPVGVLRSRPGSRQLLADAMAEIERVGRAHGIELPDGIVATTMGFLDQQPETGTTSLQRDILAGRPSELDAWTGAVVRLGAQAATATPIHSVLYEVLSLRGRLP
ncbi:MAG: 2-dehydropantoate 2-reductase [Micromonosporaceae bacterium]